jgi:protein-S-isoprenylcysteine O-methyltransferase Ste14
MSSTTTSIATASAVHPVAGAILAVQNLFKSNKFSNTSTGAVIFILFIVILFLVLWIMSLMATWRLTDSVLQVVLCFLFGCIYLFFAWIFYGFTNHKLVKISTE